VIEFAYITGWPARPEEAAANLGVGQSIGLAMAYGGTMTSNFT
jgi:hypothetical protein